jgi:threonyl-tRNA synthetase
MSDIQIAKKGNDAQSFPAGITAAEAVKALCSNKERKRTLAVRVGEDLLDLSEPLLADTEFELITTDSSEGLTILTGKSLSRRKILRLLRLK